MKTLILALAAVATMGGEPVTILNNTFQGDPDKIAEDLALCRENLKIRDIALKYWHDEFKKLAGTNILTEVEAWIAKKPIATLDTNITLAVAKIYTTSTTNKTSRNYDGYGMEFDEIRSATWVQISGYPEMLLAETNRVTCRFFTETTTTNRVYLDENKR
jgi:hypothetical protein